MLHLIAETRQSKTPQPPADTISPFFPYQLLIYAKRHHLREPSSAALPLWFQANLNWTMIMKQINETGVEGFYDDGGWKFLNMQVAPAL